MSGLLETFIFSIESNKIHLIQLLWLDWIEFWLNWNHCQLSKVCKLKNCRYNLKINKNKNKWISFLVIKTIMAWLFLRDSSNLTVHFSVFWECQTSLLTVWLVTTEQPCDGLKFFLMSKIDCRLNICNF